MAKAEDGGQMGVISARQHAFALGFFLPRLGLVEAPVVTAPGHEFVVGAFFHFLAFVYDDEAVGLVEGGEAVGDGDGGAAFDEVVQRFLDFALGFSNVPTACAVPPSALRPFAGLPQKEGQKPRGSFPTEFIFPTRKVRVRATCSFRNS